MKPEDQSRAAEAALFPSGILDRLIWLCGLVSALLIVLILGVTAIAVVFRYLLDRPLLGTDEATGFLVVAVVMFGAAEALRRNDHINIDILTTALPRRLRRWFDAIGYMAVLVFSVGLFVTAWRTVTFSFNFDAYSTGALEMPLWIPQSTMLLGAVLLTLISGARLLALVLQRPVP